MKQRPLLHLGNEFLERAKRMLAIREELKTAQSSLEAQLRSVRGLQEAIAHLESQLLQKDNETSEALWAIIQASPFKVIVKKRKARA